jgi:hypothetical protein
MGAIEGVLQAAKHRREYGYVHEMVVESGSQTGSRSDLRITSRKQEVHAFSHLACRCLPTCAPVRE